MAPLDLTSIDFGKDFWKTERKLSGRSIDVLRGQNIPGNSKTIDRTESLDCIVSHKSTDIRLRSYQMPGRLYYLGMKYVRQLSGYAGEIRMDHKIGATYNLQWMLEGGQPIRKLEWFIPEMELETSQKKILERIILEANLHNVEVKIYAIRDY